MLVNLLNGLVGVLGNLLNTLGGNSEPPSQSPLPTFSEQALMGDNVNDKNNNG